MHRRPSRARDVALLLQAARRAGVDVSVAPPGTAPSDGLAARWAGLPTILVSSVAANRGYPHDHRPSNVPANVNAGTVLAARRRCAQAVALMDDDRHPAPDTTADPRPPTEPDPACGR